MNYSDKDLNAAIDASIITADQVKSFRGFLNTRQVSQYVTGPDEEPFEVFNGFNEIFIVFGLFILFSGWWRIFATYFDDASKFTALGFYTFEIIIICLLAEYFTKRRPMIAPSNLLVILFIISGFNIGDLIEPIIHVGSGEMGFPRLRFTYAFLPSFIAAIAVYIYWRRYQVPMALAGILFFGLLGSVGIFNWYFDIKDTYFLDLFTLDTKSPVGWATLSVGLIGLVFAMRFDLSDPHRITRRTRNAFWLHIASAPLIVNPIVYKIDYEFGVSGGTIMILFFLLIALMTIIIDRRSFLIIGIGQMILLLYSIFEENVGILIFALGISLVLLGSAWTQLRARVMDLLPDFPYKSKLAPWREGTE